MSGIFSIYTENNTSPITLHMTGGIDHIETSSINPYYLPLNNIYIPSISGPKTNRWNSYILSNSGSILLSLDSSIPSFYSVTQSTLDSLGSNTLLYSFPDFVTIIKDCYIDSSYTGFDCIVAYGIDFTRSMDLYTQNGTVGLSFSLLNGAIPETYVAASYSYDGSNTYIYRDDSVPTQYNDHSQFEIYVENIVEFTTDCIIDSGIGVQSIVVQNGLDISSSLNLYTKPLSIYLSGGAIPETYVIDTYYFDGFYNYIYDGASIGTLYNDHTKMTIMKPQVNGEVSTPDYTTGTYSVYANDEDIIIQSGVYFDGTDTYLYDDNGYGLIYTEHGGNVTKGYNENEWVNIIITNEYSTKRVTLFLNGEKIVDVTTINFFHGQINSFRIGIGYDSGRFFEGNIPYVGLYNRSLSESECLDNYNVLKWRFI